jgi:trigger factor
MRVKIPPSPSGKKYQCWKDYKLKIETETRDDHQVKLIVELEPEMLERKMHKAARQISEQNKFPGFRPGKAPYDIVLRVVGEERVQQEAIELLVDEVYPEALKEQNIEPAAIGSLEEIISTNPPKFSFIVPLKPVVALGDYQAVRVPYAYPGVSPEEEKEAIEKFRSSYSTFEPVDRPAKEEDVLSITYSAYNITENGEEMVFEDRPLQVRILKKDEEREAEYPFNGFSRHFLKAKALDERDLEFTYPEDYTRLDQKGKKFRYHVKLDAVKKVVLPEVNEEFIKNFGEFKSVDDFKAEITKQLEANKLADYDYQYYKQIIDKIKSGATIKFPPQFLEDEKAEVTKSIEHDLSHQKMDLESYLKIRQLTREEFVEKEVVPSATERLERSLILNELSKAENIVLTDEDMQTSYTETLNEMVGTPDFEKLQKKMPKKKLIDAIAMEAASRAMNRRVFESLKKIATGEADLPKADESSIVEPATDSAKAKPKARKSKKAVDTKED